MLVKVILYESLSAQNQLDLYFSLFIGNMYLDLDMVVFLIMSKSLLLFFSGIRFLLQFKQLNTAAVHQLSRTSLRILNRIARQPAFCIHA